MMEKYSWDFNKNAEIWYNETYDTVDDCIADAVETAKEDGEDYDTVYVGENIPYIPSIDAESILDALQEQAYDFAGEIGGDWCAYNHKQTEELEELSELLSTVVCDWMKKYGYYPTFYAIEKIKPYPMPKGE